MVKDLIHLFAELGVDLGDHPVDQAFLYGFVTIMWLDQLCDKRRHAALGDAISLVVGAEQCLGNDVIEDATAFDNLYGLRAVLNGGHGVSVL